MQTGDKVLIRPTLKLGIIVADLQYDEYAVSEIGNPAINWYHKNHLILWTQQNEDAFAKANLKFIIKEIKKTKTKSESSDI